MMQEALSAKYPNHRIEDRSVAIDELPAWVWVLMILLVLLPIGLFFLFLDDPENNFASPWGWIILTVVLMFLHEGTHAVAWKVASRLPWSSFKFGIQWKTLSPYCHSKHPMPVIPYRIGAAMPLILTGLLPYIYGFIVNSGDIAVASSILIGGAAGDIYILWAIRDLPSKTLLQDHDANAGCLVLWPEEV